MFGKYDEWWEIKQNLRKEQLFIFDVISSLSEVYFQDSSEDQFWVSSDEEFRVLTDMCPGQRNKQISNIRHEDFWTLFVRLFVRS